MQGFDKLIQARTEAEFFVVLCNVIHPYSDGFKPENRQKNLINSTDLLRGGGAKDGYALKFEITHTLSMPNSRGGRDFQSEKTHVFTFYEDGTLTWWMLGQSDVISGLKNIQQKLKQLRGGLEEHFLPSFVER